MKTTIKVEKEIDIKGVGIRVPVRYGEEDIPNNFPMRKGDVWEAFVFMDSGKIRDWPIGRSGSMHMKVCDSGQYFLYDEKGNVLASLYDYVPNKLIPGEYGDYIELDINADGIITNWYREPDVSQFFGDQE